MDISAIINNKDDGQGISTIPTDITNDGGSGNQIDPLANFELGDNGEKLEFNANDTIATSDNTSVGGYSAIKDATNDEPAQDEPELDESANIDNNSTISEVQSDFVITDPAKMDFVRTYTKEYDDLVATTTHAVELILASIDKTVKEHTNDIDIPEEAIEFLTDKPKDNKVSKFDDAQQIIRIVMGQASEAKKQAEQAAMEASNIYDNIQQFKLDTTKQIASIRNRDEFGRPKDKTIDLGAMDSTNADNLPDITKMI